ADAGVVARQAAAGPCAAHRLRHPRAARDPLRRVHELPVRRRPARRAGDDGAGRRAAGPRGAQACLRRPARRHPGRRQGRSGPAHPGPLPRPLRRLRQHTGRVRRAVELHRAAGQGARDHHRERRQL
ncbi:MAG: hypothetical protein AVDCRST_MAG07-3121, partial [uncultured Frankineae bacterium]